MLTQRAVGVTVYTPLANALATMKVKVMFFAKSREVAGCSECVVEMEDGAQTRDLLMKLYAQYPALETVMKSCVLAVNQEYIQLDQQLPLKETDEVAIIPPLSGG